MTGATLSPLVCYTAVFIVVTTLKMAVWQTISPLAKSIYYQ